MGLKPTEIIEGYNLASKKIIDEILPKLVVKEIKDLKNVDEIKDVIRTSIMTKQYGYEDFLTNLVIKACLAVFDDVNSYFNVDNVRICKILGAGIESSQVVTGMVFKKMVIFEIFMI